MRARARVSAFAGFFALAGVVLMGLVVWQLSKEEVRTTSTSGAEPSAFVVQIPASGGAACQSQGDLPASTARLRLTVGTYGRPGPALQVLVRRQDGSVDDLGGLTTGWPEGVVEIPLDAHPTYADLEICIRSVGGSRVAIAGEAFGAHTVRGAEAPGVMSLVGMAEDAQSFAELFGALGRRIARGGSEVLGSWSAALVALLFLAASALGARAIWLTRRGGGASLAVIAATLCLGAAWAILIPPFQVADEISHVAYVQYLAEEGDLPEEAPIPAYSEEERAVLDVLGFNRIIGRPSERVPSTPSDEQRLRQVERSAFAAENGGNASTASANPPLYYLLQAPVFLATGWLGLTTQVLAMRLVSVLLTALAVLFAFRFVRELLPRSPWSWTAAGLACAFLPILGFAGAGVNADALLIAAAAATAYQAAVILRRGLTARRAMLLGLSVAVGLLTKPLFLALVPAALAALVLGAGASKRRAVSVGLVTMVVPTAVVAFVAAQVFGHPYLPSAAGVASSATGATGAVYTRAQEASYILQLFLPRLPFLTDQIPGEPMTDVWIRGLVGVFGWIDYGFPEAAVTFGSRLFVVLLALAAAAVIRFRRTVMADWRLAICCLAAIAGVLGAIGVVDFQSTVGGGFKYQQARYLLPLLALYGGLYALAIKGLGARAAPYAATVFWVLGSFHTLSALVLTANRYYL